MGYQKIEIDTATPSKPVTSVLIIYTGGTMGMGHDSHGILIPFDFQQIMEKIPSLITLNLKLTVIAFEKPLDSSNVKPEHWIEIGSIIFDQYHSNDGFVVLHGTDTMAYTASAISFMLKGLNKPVIFTGAQLPISATRSDARENLITAIEIASAKSEGKPLVPEVCIYFDYFLFRGNRCKKVESSHFDAFKSENYPPLAQAGVAIEYNKSYIREINNEQLRFNKQIDDRVVILKLFPGINENVIKSTLNISNLRGVVLETFGSGNTNTDRWFLECLESAVKKGIIIMNVSQCDGGKVLQGKYETSRSLGKLGVISGSDITTESAITKMMILLGKEKSLDEVKKQLVIPICGEIN